jgi:hypothetical protein
MWIVSVAVATLDLAVLTLPDHLDTITLRRWTARVESLSLSAMST